MAREWSALCKDCGERFGYSDQILRAARRCGERRPERCNSCEGEWQRERRYLSMPEVPLCSAESGQLRVSPRGPIGRLPVRGRWHAPVDCGPDYDTDKFGIKDEHMVELLELLRQPDVKVVVAVAPTGSGKSTLLPFRLLSPPDAFPDREMFTRLGQIVITQPRKQAASNIPAFVSKKMHGASLGVGFDIGYRHSGAHFSDWNNKLVYCTDGTLINWIASGQLDKISLIIIDEAHERSLNIDIIIGLLTKLLPRYPRLKLLIVSATIDEQKFNDHFNAHLPRPLRCEITSLPGKKGYDVTPH